MIGNSVVVWVRSTEGSIMAQRISPAGQPLWSDDITLNATPGGCTIARLAVLPNGNAIVVWQQLFEKTTASPPKVWMGLANPLGWQPYE